MRPNVLFINLPSLPYDELEKSLTDSNKTPESLSMPMGILYLSAYIKRGGNVGHVGLLDYPLLLQDIDKFPSIEAFIRAEAQTRVDFTPDIIAIALMFSTSHIFFESATRVLKSLWPQAIIVVGGVHATNCIKLLLAKDEIDYVVRGEGEIVFAKLVEQVAGNIPIKADGICSRDDINQENLPFAERITDLDSLPYPDWDLIETDIYLKSRGRRRSVEAARDKNMATILTTRGCPFHCTFCTAHTVQGRKVRFRSVQKVVEEMKLLHERYGVTLFIPEDDLFAVNRKRVIHMLKEMKSLGIPDLELQFPNGLSIATLNEEIIDALISVGTNVFNLAIDSGSAYVQKNIMKKNCNLAKARELVRICRNKGVIVRCYFIFGFPGESKELMNESVEYMKSLGADWCVTHIASPLIGSEMYKQFIERGDIKEDIYMWSKSCFQSRIFDSKELSAAELESFVYRVNLEVNFLNNPNLKDGRFDRAIAIFNDIKHKYPFHIFAWYCLYLAYSGKKNLHEAATIHKHIDQLLITDPRSKKMYAEYGDLLPQRVQYAAL